MSDAGGRRARPPRGIAKAPHIASGQRHTHTGSPPTFPPPPPSVRRLTPPIELITNHQRLLRRQVGSEGGRVGAERERELELAPPSQPAAGERSAPPAPRRGCIKHGRWPPPSGLAPRGSGWHPCAAHARRGGRPSRVRCGEHCARACGRAAAVSTAPRLAPRLPALHVCERGPLLTRSPPPPPPRPRPRRRARWRGPGHSAPARRPTRTRQGGARAAGRAEPG